jgi:hypothetical protein
LWFNTLPAMPSVCDASPADPILVDHPDLHQDDTAAFFLIRLVPGDRSRRWRATRIDAARHEALLGNTGSIARCSSSSIYIGRVLHADLGRR